jgi:hypothetical protein
MHIITFMDCQDIYVGVELKDVQELPLSEAQSVLMLNDGPVDTGADI